LGATALSRKLGALAPPEHEKKPTRSKRLLIVLVAGVATVVPFAAGNAIGSSGRLAGPPVAYNSAGEPVIKSPNGQFSTTVGNAGIVLKGPSFEAVSLAPGRLTIAKAQHVDIRAMGTLNLEADQAVSLKGSTVGFTGSSVQLNGCAQPVVPGTDSVSVTGNIGRIVPGQTAVYMG
jgi:hypothetical protein